MGDDPAGAITCPRCHGKGKVPVFDVAGAPPICWRCSGKGTVEKLHPEEIEQAKREGGPDAPGGK